MDAPSPARRPRVTAGRFRRIYDPGAGEAVEWYVNDHTLVRAAGGWHLFGITHPEPAAPQDEHLFAHATAPGLHGPWQKQPPCLAADPIHGETHLWAPHVLTHAGLHYMFYAGGGADPTASAINLATSTDLYHWTRHPAGPLFRDGFQARDPMVARVDERWVLYYCATDDPAGGHHVVAYRTSDDLLQWGPRRVAYTSPRRGTGGGDTESPFLVRRGADYYLFVVPCGAYGDQPDGYTCTAVYRSDTPYHFDPGDRVARLPSHAAEIVHTGGTWWITHAGWGQAGVYLAPLWWHEAARSGRRVGVTDRFEGSWDTP
jgi:beta-fructofuranosidase